MDRGYTGHEHLQSVGLIHMNGRLYDPKLHRFLQTDNYVQDPSNTQNYNRYGYVLNNPLKYTDPSGWETEEEKAKKAQHEEEERLKREYALAYAQWYGQQLGIGADGVSSQQWANLGGEGANSQLYNSYVSQNREEYNYVMQQLDAFAKEKFGDDYKTKYGVVSLKWGSQMQKGEVEGYSYDSKEMVIVGPKGAAGGITTPDRRVYISDIYKTFPNAFLEVTIGHEFIHSYQRMTFGSNYNPSYSEFSAHQYSIDFSLKNSNIIDGSNLKFYQSEQLNFKKDKTGRYNYQNIPGF